MARVERAHPENPDFKKGKKPYKMFTARHKRCLPFVEGKVVLDVPCGVGWGTSFFKAAKEVHGLDNDGPSIEYGRAHWPGLQLQIGDMRDMPYMSNYFDVVVCLEGYEHLAQNDQGQVMKEVKRVLKVGGMLLMTIPLAGYSKGKNPYHLYEPTLEEVALVLSDFIGDELEENGGILWYAGKLLQ